MSSIGKATTDDNLSDFDNSDDDLADLLADDDDDIFAKKLSTSSAKENLSKYSNVSPKKEKLTDKTSFDRKNSFANLSPEKKKSTDFNTLLKNSPKHSESRKSSDAFEGDALSEFLKETSSKPKTSSPVKKSSDHDESKYLEDLGFTKLSNKTTSLKSDQNTFLKEEQDDFNSDNDDLLKSLDSDHEDKSSPNSPRKRSDSYFDDFLNTLSPKHSAKKMNSVSVDLKKDSSNRNFKEDTVLTETRKGSILPESNSQKRRDSTFKQVSFKELHEDSLKISSPEKEKTSLESKSEKVVINTKTSKTALPKTKRSEKMAGSKDDDMDWSSFFKESPKKNKTVEKTSKKLNNDDVPPSDKLINRRKSSSAEWLGLSEPNTPSKLSSSVIENKSNFNDKNSDWLGSGEITNSLRSKSAGESTSRSRRPRVAPSVNADWLSQDFTPTSADKTKVNDQSEIKKSFLDLTDKQRSQNDQEKAAVDKEYDNISSVGTKGASTHLTSTAESVIKYDTSSNEVNSQVLEKVLNSQIVSHSLPVFPQNSILSSSNVIPNTTENITTLMNNYILERDQLLKSSDTLKAMYEDRIKAMENLHRNQLKSTEESFKILENNLNKEKESKIKDFEDQLNIIKIEKDASEKDLKNKLSEMEKEHMKEVQKLKELHSLSINQMKQDHDEAINRLKRLKDQEVEAVLSTQAHSRSLQSLADQLEARTSELSVLQTKVEERNQSTLMEKKTLLDAKEKELKALQTRLQKQLEDGDEERIRLQQLVLRLESRLQKSTTEGEEDRWEVQQVKARLKVQQKYLDEEYKLKMEQIEREKEKLQMSQNSLLQEQKIVLLQLAQERQQLSQEKNDLDLLSKRIKEEESKFNVKRLKEESYIERQKQVIQQEENRLSSEKSNLKMEQQQLDREKELLDRDKQEFVKEKERFNDYSLKIKRKADAIEILALSTAEEKENARLEQSAANKIRNEHQSKLQQISQQMQNLMDKEHQILQEKEKLAEEKYELEAKKNSMMCVKCKLSLQHCLNVPAQNVSVPPLMAYPVTNGFSNRTPQTFFDPNLVVWQISAQKDHAFLEEELSYLRSLKESSKKLDYK